MPHKNKPKAQPAKDDGPQRASLASAGMPWRRWAATRFPVRCGRSLTRLQPGQHRSSPCPGSPVKTTFLPPDPGTSQRSKVSKRMFDLLGSGHSFRPCILIIALFRQPVNHKLKSEGSLNDRTPPLLIYGVSTCTAHTVTTTRHRAGERSVTDTSAALRHKYTPDHSCYPTKCETALQLYVMADLRRSSPLYTTHRSLWSKRVPNLPEAPVPKTSRLLNG